MNIEQQQREAMEIEAEAWKLIKPFDDLAEGLDRRIPYAAFILMMTSFIRSSHAPAETILGDFNERVMASINAPAAVTS